MNKDGSQAIAPKITVEQALTRLLELIRTSKTMYDFTPERVGQVMQVPIEWAKDGSDRFGHGELVTPQWNLGFGVDRDRGAEFQLFLDPNPPGTYPPMTGICQLDFDRFTGELEAMGFLRSHSYDAIAQMDVARLAREAAARGSNFDPGPPPLMYDYFDRPNMRVEVHLEGESKENAQRGCVREVRIYQI